MMGMSMGMGMEQVPEASGPSPSVRWGTYTCSHCGEQHASDETEILCPAKPDGQS